MNTYEALKTKSSLWETLPDTAAEMVSGGITCTDVKDGFEAEWNLCCGLKAKVKWTGLDTSILRIQIL